jgi:MarR family 2-MHQ and catechol resistance regulon transcriptional repressor
MGTHFLGSAEEIRALDLYIKLSRASDAVNGQINQHLADYNLTISQFGILESIYHLGPLTQKAIGSKILKSSGNITFVVDNLVKRNLVRRERDTVDRRQVFLHLTDAGKALIAGIFPKHVTGVVQAMQTLTIAEQEQLAMLCKKLGIGRQI